MASSTAHSINVHRDLDQSISSKKEPFDRICARCGGLLVNHICMDFYNNGNELEIPAQRCVQCGDIVDSVILKNRRITHESTTTHQAEITVFSPEVPIAATKTSF